MKNLFTIIFFLIILLTVSCKEKDVIEIYLTKNKIESYDGVPLRTAIKDSIIIKQVLEAYGEELRIDTVKDKSIYMGHFSVEKRICKKNHLLIIQRF